MPPSKRAARGQRAAGVNCCLLCVFIRHTGGDMPRRTPRRGLINNHPSIRSTEVDQRFHCLTIIGRFKRNNAKQMVRSPNWLLPHRLGLIWVALPQSIIDCYRLYSQSSPARPHVPGSSSPGNVCDGFYRAVSIKNPVMTNTILSKLSEFCFSHKQRTKP